MMRHLAKWHIWLGWLIGVPLLLWTFSGLWMVARPIEEVRGTALRAEPARLAAITAPVLPATDVRPVERIELVQRIDQPVWIVRFADGEARAASVATGRMLPRVDAPLARRIADAALAAPADVEGASAFAASDAPIELRKQRPCWQIRYVDGMHVYVDALTGEVLAARSRQWRLYDIMWGVHIMDLQTREDSHNPVLIGVAALSLLGSLMGTVLLFRRRKTRVRGAGQSPLASSSPGEGPA